MHVIKDVSDDMHPWLVVRKAVQVQADVAVPDTSFQASVPEQPWRRPNGRKRSIDSFFRLCCGQGNNVCEKSMKVPLHFVVSAIVLTVSMTAAGMAQALEPTIETFDGGWDGIDRSFDCLTNGSRFEIEVSGGVARVYLNGDYKPPVHLTYSPKSVVYLFGTNEKGIGLLVDFQSGEFVRRDYGLRPKGVKADFIEIDCE